MRKLNAVLGGCALTALTASAANAALITFDLRAAEGTAKTVEIQPGQAASVTLNLYAVWAPAAGENSFLKGWFGFNSTEATAALGGLMGDLGGVANSSAISAVGTGSSTAGFQQSIDANPDLEIGGLTSQSSTDTKWVYLISAGITTYVPAVNNELLLGSVTYTVTAANAVAGDFTDANVFIRPKGAGPSGTNAFKANGVTVSSLAGTDTRQAVGTPVHIVVTPEPASLSLLGIGAAGLLARRRHA